MTNVNIFGVPIFFIVFRETLEASIIISMLLTFLKQTLGPARNPKMYKGLVRQVWLGAGLGFLVCMVIGAGIIGTFYTVGQNKWANTAEYWEGALSIIASVIISLMGAALLRVSKLQDKWRAKLAQSFEAKPSNSTAKSRFKRWCEKYAMFVLPFVTVLREGVEVVIFVSGVSYASPASAFPLPAVVGLACGGGVGVALFKGSRFAPIQIFLVISTCFLYLVAAGLFSKGVWYIEAQWWAQAVGSDVDGIGDGPGSYDITKSVWHVNCCNPDTDGGGGWGIFNHLLGWQNSATYGSVISYNLYWVFVILGIICMGYNEREGHWPWRRANKNATPATASEPNDHQEGVLEDKNQANLEASEIKPPSPDIGVDKGEKV